MNNILGITLYLFNI